VAGVSEEKMNKFILSCFVGLMSVNAFAMNSRIMNCEFTEPFFSLELNLDTGKLLKTEYDWQDLDPNSDYLTTVIQEAATTKVKPSDKTMQVTVLNPKSNMLVLGATLNFKGTDSMSEVDYPLDVVYIEPNGTKQFGGCELGALKSYSSLDLSPDMLAFSKDATQAMGLCFNRALSNWTIERSDFLPSMSKYYILYKDDVVPGEPGNVSQSFSSAEKDVLRLLLLEAKDPPYNANALKSVREAMWNHCMQYSEFLEKRFTLN